ncbi:MAG: tetraacyldisaccharide 4'-kinase [Nitrospinota bacterium]
MRGGLRPLWARLSEEKGGPLAEAALLPLLPVSWAYGLGVRARLSLYGLGAFKRASLTSPVISVGNLTLGGSGKTPASEAIARLLLQEGFRVAVLSRGYGGRARGSLTVVSDGKRLLASPPVAADEAILLARNLPGLLVLTGRSRLEAGTHAIESLGAEVIILDDGFQHLALERDLDLLLVRAKNPWGRGRLFPRGSLREPLSALSRAGAVVMVSPFRAEARPPEELLSALERYNPAAPLFRACLEFAHLRLLGKEGELPLDALGNTPFLALCGIASPESFFSFLRELGLSPRGELALSDHYRYCREDLPSLREAARAAGASAIVTTQKDAVKLEPLAPLPLPIWEVGVRLRVLEEGSWRELILSVARSPRRTIS